MPTTFYLVRHGKPDWDWATERRFFGPGSTYMPLTEAGVEQLEQTALDARLKEATMILSSPYTRTMQSAQILSRRLDLPVTVEWELHEWLYDVNMRGDLPEEGSRYCAEDLHACWAKYMETDTLEGEDACETRSVIRERVLACLARYNDGGTYIVSCHEGVIRCITGLPVVAYGEIVPFTLS